MDYYSFELRFTGLCIFTFIGDRRTPSDVNVHLVATASQADAHLHGAGHEPHIPYLSYLRRDLSGDLVGIPHALVPNPDGTQTVLHGIAGEAFEIISPNGMPSSLDPKWRDTIDLPPYPQNTSQEKWLDWVPALRKVNDTTPPPQNTVYAGLEPLSLNARVHFTKGELFAGGFPRQLLNPTNHVIWEFLVPPATTSDAGDPTPQAMAGTISLLLSQIPVSESVFLRGRRLNVSFKAPQNPDGTYVDKVSVSITNLPASETERDEYLRHFEHFYDPVVWPSTKPPLRVPKPQGGGITTGNTFCPPSTHI